QVRGLFLEPLGSVLVEVADPLGFDGEVDRTARVPAFVGGAFAPESRRHFGKERLQPDWERFDAPERPLIMGVGRKSWIVDQQHYDQHEQDLTESARNVVPIGHFPEDAHRLDCEEYARYRRDSKGDEG